MEFQFGLVVLIVLAGLAYFIHQEYTNFVYEKEQREKEVNEFEEAMKLAEEAPPWNTPCVSADTETDSSELIKDYAFFIISPQAMVEYVETEEGVETNYQVYDGKDVNGNDTFRYANYFSSDSFENHLKQASDNKYERLA